jgi:ubiquinone biosynthesis monooxygenase Coq7
MISDALQPGLRRDNPGDRFLVSLQAALTAVFSTPPSGRPDPARAVRATAGPLDDVQRRHAAALMRVNHVGEICAQALYDAQGAWTRSPRLATVFRRAGAEESDHLAWTAGRVRELGSHTSHLAPLWYAGAWTIGSVAAHLGDRASLGFMSETERQVEAHLAGHLERLPAEDTVSRAIVEQMKQDEVAHGQVARDEGGMELPGVVRWGMRAMARVMTSTAYYV